MIKRGSCLSMRKGALAFLAEIESPYFYEILIEEISHQHCYSCTFSCFLRLDFCCLMILSNLKAPIGAYWLRMRFLLLYYYILSSCADYTEIGFASARIRKSHRPHSPESIDINTSPCARHSAPTTSQPPDPGPVISITASNRKEAHIPHLLC